MDPVLILASVIMLNLAYVLYRILKRYGMMAATAWAWALVTAFNAWLLAMHLYYLTNPVWLMQMMQLQ